MAKRWKILPDYDLRQTYHGCSDCDCHKELSEIRKLLGLPQYCDKKRVYKKIRRLINGK